MMIDPEAVNVAEPVTMQLVVKALGQLTVTVFEPVDEAAGRGTLSLMVANDLPQVRA